MDVYKDFIQLLRRKEFEHVYILLTEDYTFKLKEFVQLLRDVKFVDDSYCAYYGDVKKIITCFMNFFGSTIDELIQEADRCANQIDKTELMFLIDRTIAIHHSNQIEFGEAFLPVTSSLEKNIYEEIQNEYMKYDNQLREFRETLAKIDKQEKVEEFAKEHFGIAVARASEIINFTYVFLAMMLADTLNQIRVSLEEIHLRMRKNLKKLQEEREEGVSELLHRLYEKNKEENDILRTEKQSPMELAEVGHSIQKLRKKIQSFGTKVPISRVHKEVLYWDKRIKEFNVVASNLTKLKAEQDDVAKQEQIYNSMRINELPGSKHYCWLNMGENFAERKKYLKEKILETARTLITFFCVKGTDHIFYTDNIGPFYVDEFCHQVYVFDYGLGIYHIDCKGEFREPEEFPYYFGKAGRYIYKDGEKLYQCGACTSLYQLSENEQLHRVTVDCGHSERINKACRMEISDPTDVDILPDFQPFNIKNTLDSETVKYLWDSFGCVLPLALQDVCEARPRNPIHFLAHKLLHHKYSRTTSELLQKRKEADEYRSNKHKERTERATAASREWKARQVKRRLPEETDDEDIARAQAAAATEHFVNLLNNYE